MRTETWGGLRVRIVGGSDRMGGGDGPAVVLLHGFGAPGDDLLPLFGALDVPRKVRFVFPEGPLSLPELGPQQARAWWHIDTSQRAAKPRDRSAEMPEGLAAASTQLHQLLDVVEQALGIGGERIVLGGFSQGSMLCCDVALHGQRRLAGLAVLSGTLLAKERWRGGAAAQSGLPVFQSHGTADPLLPFASAEQLRDLLTEAGCQVDWRPFQGQHEIPQGVLSGLGNFIHTHT